MTLLKNKFNLFTISAIALSGLIGCSSLLKPEQELDVGPFVNMIVEACASSDKFNQLSRDSKKAACQKVAVKSIDSSKEYLMRFKSQEMKEACEGRSGQAMTACLEDYQKDFYRKHVSSVISSTYK